MKAEKQMLVDRVTRYRLKRYKLNDSGEAVEKSRMPSGWPSAFTLHLFG